MTDLTRPPTPTYDLTLPKGGTGAVVFSSPHSGADYPQDMIARTHLPMKVLRSSEDAFVNALFASAPDFGAPLLAARLPRAWIDLNRAEDELDPALIAGAPRSMKSPRINAGLGVIPRVVAESRSIYSGKISMREAKARIASGHVPYHRKLTELLAHARDLHGRAILFDCHSMPNDALAGSPMVNGARPEIVLGDRFGASCDRWLIEAAMDMFSAAGFRVTRNAPFAGGYITQHYGRPSRNIHALQIEIDRSLYMDEAQIKMNARFASVERQLRDIVRQLCRLGLETVPIAAE